MASQDSCRFCGTQLRHSFCDLGLSPLANELIDPKNADRREAFYPLHAKVCSECFLVQVPELENPETIFSNYVYFSSYSKSWLDHAKQYSDLVIQRFKLDKNSSVIEIASNDGYLLKNFKNKGMKVLGIEPAANVATVAMSSAGVPTLIRFFGMELATELRTEGTSADLLIGNNVLAHVPDINDFVKGMKHLLSPEGVITMEFPHLLNLIEKRQFDTIYHEHFSYLSFLAVKRIFAAHGLKLFDVDELPTHGGSLRIYAAHAESKTHPELPAVAKLLEKESDFGLDKIETYLSFQQQAEEVRDTLVAFLKKCRQEGKKVAGYGAPAKGNTLLNFAKINAELLPYTVDISPYKQNKLLPGVRVPVFAPEKILADKPDFVLLLPWNIKSEILSQMGYIREWGGKFVVPIPTLEIL